MPRLTEVREQVLERSLAANVAWAEELFGPVQNPGYRQTNRGTDGFTNDVYADWNGVAVQLNEGAKYPYAVLAQLCLSCNAHTLLGRAIESRRGLLALLDRPDRLRSPQAQCAYCAWLSNAKAEAARVLPKGRFAHWRFKSTYRDSAKNILARSR